MEFAPCEIKVDDGDWVGVRRKYWHFDQYFLPICKLGKAKNDDDDDRDDERKKTLGKAKSDDDDDRDDERKKPSVKRQKF